MVMVKRVIPVCNVCDKPDATEVTIILDGKRRTLDLCEEHIAETRRLWSLGDGKDARTGGNFNDIAKRFQRNQ